MVTADQWRTLRGGPRDGDQLAWSSTSAIEIPVHCPIDPVRFDIARYDRYGAYVHSTHPPTPVYRSFLECCSLCPGHRVSSDEDPVTYQHGSHP